jgi:hypothetical protein
MRKAVFFSNIEIGVAAKCFSVVAKSIAVSLSEPGCFIKHFYADAVLGSAKDI